MKFLIQYLAIVFLAHLLGLLLPWYAVAIAAFAMGVLLKSKYDFLAGFCAIATLWLFNAWLYDSSSTADLADRVARIFLLPSAWMLYAVIAIIGGLVGGFATLTGSLLRK
jgi:hypothetical protein